MDEKEKKVREIIGVLQEPKLKWKIEDLQLLRYVKVEENVLWLTIELIANDLKLHEQFKVEVEDALEPFNFTKINLTLRKANTAGEGIEGVRKVFMVGSGKGGVGKSSIAVNIAITLSKRGYRVGLLDADIYGPSIPLLLNLAGQKPRVLDNDVLEPIFIHNIKTLSIGNLVPSEAAVSWRGQLVSGTILQFIRKTDWGFLDFLIIDMPPGTGDVQLTLASELKVDGAMMVSMEQELVIEDVVRSIAQLDEKNIPLLGIINNMTSFCCEKCGHEQTLFTSLENRLENVNVIANLPMDKDFCLAGNSGKPYMLNQHSGRLFREFSKIADTLEELLVCSS